MYKQFINKIFQQNTYLLIDNKDCVIIDPGGDEMDIIEYIKENELDLKAILITHGHFDHILNIKNIMEYKKVPIYIGKQDKKFLFDHKFNLSQFIDIKFELNDEYEIIEINDGDTVFGLNCMNTPGHTLGSICYYDEKNKNLFTGDTIFKGTYGRVDFPTGDATMMRDSLNRILKMDKDIVIHPGRGPSTTIDEEYITYYGYY